MSQSTVMSLYIPHVFGNVTKEMMIKTIEFQGLGKVEKIDFVEKMGKNGKIYNNAFVHFEYWYDNISSVHFQQRVKDTNKEARIVYKDPWFWVCFENTGKKHIPGERKERINLKAFNGLDVNHDDDLTQVFEFEEEKNELVLPQEIEDKFERELLEEFDCGGDAATTTTVCDLTPYQTKNNFQINMEYVRHLEMLNYKLVHDLYELRGDFITTF
jgi:hypothetical protein